MIGLCGSIIELHSLCKKQFRQGGEKKKNHLMIWVGGYQVACTWQKLSREIQTAKEHVRNVRS